jgi:hypothetical protein
MGNESTTLKTQVIERITSTTHNTQVTVGRRRDDGQKREMLAEFQVGHGTDPSLI